MTKEEAITYCYKHADEYKRDCYTCGDNGERLFECLIAGLEFGSIKPEELDSYGMSY